MATDTDTTGSHAETRFDDPDTRFRLKVAYDKISDAAKEAAEEQSFPCEKGCSWCCRRPVLVSDGDVAVMKAGVDKLSDEAFSELAGRAKRFADLFAAASKEMIRERPEVAAVVFARTWPKAGVPCPALEEVSDSGQLSPGRGTCVLYDHRPLECRLHYAMEAQSGSKRACSPAGVSLGLQVALLDAREAHQGLIDEHKLALVGLLGLELDAICREKVS